MRRDFTAQTPGATMVGDITQVDTGEGPLYLATVIDCFSKAVLGWATDERYPAALVCSAVDMAASRIMLPSQAVFHSDRGSQYTPREFAASLAEHGITQSVGHTGMLRERATRIAVDARRDAATSAGAIKWIADQLGIHPEALRTWVKQAEIDGGTRPGTTTSDAERIAQLERENRELGGRTRS